MITLKIDLYWISHTQHDVPKHYLLFKKGFWHIKVVQWGSEEINKIIQREIQENTCYKKSITLISLFFHIIGSVLDIEIKEK